MKNLYVYLSLCFIGILIPVLLMRFVDGNIGVYGMGVYCLVYRPIIDKMRLNAKGVKHKNGYLLFNWSYLKGDYFGDLYSR